MRHTVFTLNVLVFSLLTHLFPTAFAAENGPLSVDAALEISARTGAPILALAGRDT